MAVVSLKLFKTHLRADDFAQDDEYLTHLLDAAEEEVCKLTNRASDELTELGGGEWPVSLRHAVLLFAATQYNSSRESTGNANIKALPDNFYALIRPWRKFGS